MRVRDGLTEQRRILIEAKTHVDHLHPEVDGLHDALRHMVTIAQARIVKHPDDKKLRIGRDALAAGDDGSHRGAMRRS